MNHRLLAAPLARVEVRWKLCSGRVVIGPEPRVVLHVQALRDVELRTIHARLHGLPDGKEAGEFLLVTLPPVWGLRTLRPEGERWVVGRTNLPLPEGTEPLPLHNVCPSERGLGWWSVTGRIEIPRGLCVGLVARGSTAGECEVTLGGG